MGPALVSQIFSDVSSLIVKKKSSKMRHLKIRETNEGQIKEQLT